MVVQPHQTHFSGVTRIEYPYQFDFTLTTANEHFNLF